MSIQKHTFIFHCLYLAKRQKEPFPRACVRCAVVKLTMSTYSNVRNLHVWWVHPFYYYFTQVLGRMNSCWDKLRSFFASINVEPMLFLLAMSIGMVSIPSQEMYIQKTCKVNLNYSEAICDNINNHSEIQIETQKFVSEIQVCIEGKAS